MLRPKCNTNIQVYLTDLKTGHVINRSHAPPVLECRAVLLDGSAYDEHDSKPADVAITRNKEGNPLLLPHPRVTDYKLDYVAFQLDHGRGHLPDMIATASSEALLQGRKPPFRLWVHVVTQPDAYPPIHDIVSEPFVVATRRVKSATKLDTPVIDDPAGKLHHLGRETVRRLANLPAAAVEFDVQLPPLPISHVHTVGDFLTLCRLTDADDNLLHSLLSLVKLSSVKWAEARDHAATAVPRDDRPRVWAVVEGKPVLLYTCHRGEIDMDAPAALLLPSHHGAGRDAGLPPGTAWQPVRRSAWDAEQRAAAEAGHANARASWRRPGHPGWHALEGCDLQLLGNWLEPIRRHASGRSAGTTMLVCGQ